MAADPKKNSSLPRVGVVIPSYNGRDDLKACMDSLQLSTYQNLAIIVVDNCSVDGSADYVRSYWPDVILIEEASNTGFAKACNRGVSELKKFGIKYVMLLNQDTAVEPGWAEPLIGYLENHAEAAAAQSLLLRANGQEVNSVGNRIHFLGFGYAEGD